MNCCLEAVALDDKDANGNEICKEVTSEGTYTGSPGIPAGLKLYGGVQHSNALAPVPGEYRTGSVLNVKRLKALTPNNYWYKIPSWYAGTWESKNHTTYYEKNLSTGFESFPIDNTFAFGTETCGFQKDRSGQIWEYAYGKYLSVSRLEGGYVVSLVSEHEPLSLNEEEVVMRFRSRSFIVSEYSAKILRVCQRESIQTYTSVGDGVKKVDASIKEFDEDGRATRLYKVMAYKRRRQPFHCWDSYEGMNMKKLFLEYLETHGMKDRCPLLK